MGDSTESQATEPIVNGTKEKVGSSGADAIISKILSGERTVISHGASQYQVGGVSACGLAALNCTRIVLTAEQDGPRGIDLLKYVMRAKTAQVRAPDRVYESASVHLPHIRKLHRYALSGQVSLTLRLRISTKFLSFPSH